MKVEFKNFKNLYNKKCPICGDMFETVRDNQFYCKKPACKKEAMRRNCQRGNEKKKEIVVGETQEQRAYKSRENLAKADREAWEQSRLSYGKYEAAKYIETMRVKK